MPCDAPSRIQMKCHTLTDILNLIGLLRPPLAGGKGGKAMVGGGAGGGPVDNKGMLRLFPNPLELSETFSRRPDGDFAPGLGVLLNPKEEEGRSPTSLGDFDIEMADDVE